MTTVKLIISHLPSKVLFSLMMKIIMVKMIMMKMIMMKIIIMKMIMMKMIMMKMIMMKIIIMKIIMMKIIMMKIIMMKIMVIVAFRRLLMLLVQMRKMTVEFDLTTVSHIDVRSVLFHPKTKFSLIFIKN